MNPAYARWIEMSVTAAVGLLLFLMPRMSNRCLLFGVPVGDAFRRRPEARNAIAAYQWTVGAAMLGAMLVLFLTPPSVLAWARALSVFVLIGAPMVAHAWQFRRLRQFALPILQGGELELNQAPDALPRWLWLNAIPPLALVAAAAYASANWAQIPERFPIHWGLDGQPDRWTTRHWFRVRCSGPSSSPSSWQPGMDRAAGPCDSSE